MVISRGDCESSDNDIRGSLVAAIRLRLKLSFEGDDINEVVVSCGDASTYAEHFEDTDNDDGDDADDDNDCDI